ncbi:probable cyclin-dependent serine/threonine-protein kinase DDB_G0292550 [Tetranychus urticae]|uniref:probable cyclin-dependent serine/threonine-protein kinase DDB_G0292550 n=1 Tax=Tetranychus urticae TaxID=32264 RepID=UPI00077BB107|nr:probable cyclin-dependent serine/threonine-protein kinase DDB_G0292550 [Tetranychus urticae]
MWSPVQTIGRVLEDDFENCEEAPNSRCKHAMCTTPDGHIYLMGGRSGNRPLKDLWRLDPGQNTWEEVKCWGDQPPNLQEHTIIPWKDKLFVFGGEVGFSSSTETPLWILDLGTCIWRQGNSGPTRCKPGTVMQPYGRRAHSAVLYKDSMHIYGGYQDLRGSSSELWSFNLSLEQWHLVSCSLRCSDQPSPRHSHSAIVHDNCMWVYGGMTDLQEKGDFWKWNFELSQWSKVKCNKGPGNLHSHSAIKAFGCMFIFGGERDGQLLQDLWRYHFASNTWEKINIVGLMPNPRCRHTAVANPSLDIAAWDKEESESHLKITRSQSKSSYILSKSASKSNNLMPPKSISMCFGQNQQQETPLHEPNNLNKTKGKTNPAANNRNNLNQSNAINNRNKTKSAKFRSMKLCSKESFTISDDEDDAQEGDENDENGINNGQKQNKIRKSLKDKISQSRLVRSISSNSYNILHNQANGFQENGKIEAENLTEEPGINDKSILNGNNNNGNNKVNMNESKKVNNHSNNYQENTFDEDGEGDVGAQEDEDGDDGEFECDLDILKMCKSQSSEPVLETHHEFVVRKRIEGALRYGTKVRPKSEVLEGLFHLESLMEHGEYDVPSSSTSGGVRDGHNKVLNKRHTVSESMSYYSLCFPSPPYGRRIQSPEDSNDTPNGSSINGDEDTSSASTNTNRDNGSSTCHSVTKDDYNKIIVNGDSMIIETTHSTREPANERQISSHHPNGSSSDANATNINPESIHFDDHFYKALASPADATARTSGYNSSATLYTPSIESQGLPHSMSHSSGYHSFSEDSFDPPSSSSVYNPFHNHCGPHYSGHQHSHLPTTSSTNISSSSNLSFVPRRMSRLPRDNSSFELKQLSSLPFPAKTETNEGFNVRLSKDVRTRARERASLRGQSTNPKTNEEKVNGSQEPREGSMNIGSIDNKRNNHENRLWQQANVIREVVVPSSPGPRKWSSYSPVRSKVHQHHWQLCMYVFGGREQSCSQTMYKQPISVWKFYI